MTATLIQPGHTPTAGLVRPAPLVQLVRLWRVELRKLVNTTAGVILVAVAALLAGVFGGGALVLRDGVTLTGLTTMAGVPGTVIVAVLAVLLITAERSQRTAVSTFQLTPRRGRVVVAKVAAVVTVSIAVAVLSLLAAMIVMAVGSAMLGRAPVWSLDLVVVGWFVVGLVFSGLSGFALGAALNNAPLPIVIILVWPMLRSLLASIPGAASVLEWLDSAAPQQMLAGVTGEKWARLGSSAMVWIVAPLAIGIVRILKSEVR